MNLLGLIKSIHKNDNQEDFKEIAVFDLGFTATQLKILYGYKKVKVCKLEMVHPDILKRFKTAPGRNVAGWFAWKPVAIKQALEMYPYILYLDAGMRVLKPLDDMFKHIIQNDYFVVHAGHNIVDRLTKKPLEDIIKKRSIEEQEMLLDKETLMHCGGIQGLSRNMLDSYILPIYKHAYNLEIFADDGSASKGFGSGRHDQTIFSIYGRLLGMKIQPEGGWMTLIVDGKEVPFHAHWDDKKIIPESSIKY